MADNRIYVSTTVGLALGSVVLFYKYLMRHYNTHKRNGIPGPKAWPLFGSSMDMMKKGIFSFEKSMVEEYGNIVGVYMGSQPTLIISDLDILKQILIKNFDQFTNRVNRGTRQYPFRKMMTILEFDHWKHIRNSLSPTFTGGKLRRMTPAINRCGSNMVTHLLQKCEQDEVVDLKAVCTKYTMGVIASTTYGISINSWEDTDQFTVNAHRMMAPPGMLKLVIFIFFPWIKNFFNLSLFPPDVMDFFFGILNESLRRNQEEMDPTSRKTFLDLMTELHVEDPKESDIKTNDDLVKTNQGFIFSKKGLTHEEILAQCFAFFLGGYETTSILLSFLIYNLAVCPDVQERVYTEIQAVMGDQTEPDYDLIKKMTYLQMCLEESHRLYPPGFRLERACNETTEINGLRIDKGMGIVVPVFHIHRDPELWPEPDQFRPERFTPEEKAARHPMAYIPFGVGPRNCIAMRLALMEVKLAMVHLVLNFRFITCDETQIPLKLSKFQMMGEKGLKIKLLKR